MSTLILLDVDGTVCPAVRPRQGFQDWEALNIPGRGEHWVSQTMLARLQKLSAMPSTEVVWFTDWDQDALLLLQLLVVTSEHDDFGPFGWWKLEELVHLAAGAHARLLIWADDALAGADNHTGRPWRATAQAILDAASLKSVLLVPEPSKGLSLENLRLLETLAAH